MKVIFGLEDVVKFNLSEINWKDSVKNIKLYYANIVDGCRCGRDNCSNGKYEEISIEKAVELLGNKDYKIYNRYEANVIKFKRSTGDGEFVENWNNEDEIYVNLDFDKNWKHVQLVIELNDSIENLLK